MTADENVPSTSKNQTDRDPSTILHESSLNRAAKDGNAHPIAPEDRRPARGPMVDQLHHRAAEGHAVAEDRLETAARAQELIESDPRHERDQKVFELAQTGQIGKLPPAPKEPPANVEEQLASDNARLSEAASKAEGSPTGTVTSNVDSNVNTSADSKAVIK